MLHCSWSRFDNEHQIVPIQSPLRSLDLMASGTNDRGVVTVCCVVGQADGKCAKRTSKESI